jgi:hypothetical protein
MLLVPGSEQLHTQVDGDGDTRTLALTFHARTPHDGMMVEVARSCGMCTIWYSKLSKSRGQGCSPRENASWRMSGGCVSLVALPSLARLELSISRHTRRESLARNTAVQYSHRQAKGKPKHPLRRQAAWQNLMFCCEQSRAVGIAAACGPGVGCKTRAPRACQHYLGDRSCVAMRGKNGAQRNVPSSTAQV